MAETWRANCYDVAWNTNKSLCDVFNATGSSKVIRVYRVWLWSTSTLRGTTTATLITNRIQRITAASGGSTITPVTHDSTNAALDGNTTAGTGRTTTASDEFRRFTWYASNITAANDQRGWQMLIPNAEIWNSGYADTVVEPIVSRQSEGVQMNQVGTLVGGLIDTEMEFTSMSS